MRTIVDLPEELVRGLDRIGAERGVSRAALVRESVALYLEVQAAAGRDAAFGGWDGDEDGLELQRRLRGEWDER